MVARGGIAHPLHPAAMVIEEDNDHDSKCCGGSSCAAVPQSPEHHGRPGPAAALPPRTPASIGRISSPLRRRQPRSQHHRSSSTPQRHRRSLPPPPSFFNFPCNPQEMRRQKRQFLIFIRILVGYLDRKNPPLCRKVHRAVRECSKRRHHRESAVIRIHRTLREMVSNEYWQRALEYFAYFFPPPGQVGLGHYYCHYYFDSSSSIAELPIVPPDHPPAQGA